MGVYRTIEERWWVERRHGVEGDSVRKRWVMEIHFLKEKSLFHASLKGGALKLSNNVICLNLDLQLVFL